MNNPLDATNLATGRRSRRSSHINRRGLAARVISNSASGRFRGRINRDRQHLRGIAGVHSTIQGDELLVKTVRENIVSFQGQLGQVLSRTRIIIQRIHHITCSLRNRNLRGQNSIRRIGNTSNRREHLKVQVRPATNVVAGNNGLEGHLTLGVRHLNTAQPDFLGVAVRLLCSLQPMIYAESA